VSSFLFIIPGSEQDVISITIIVHAPRATHAYDKLRDSCGVRVLFAYTMKQLSKVKPKSMNMTIATGKNKPYLGPVVHTPLKSTIP